MMRILRRMSPLTLSDPLTDPGPDIPVSTPDGSSELKKLTPKEESPRTLLTTARLVDALKILSIAENAIAAAERDGTDYNGEPLDKLRTIAATALAERLIVACEEAGMRENPRSVLNLDQYGISVSTASHIDLLERVAAQRTAETVNNGGANSTIKRLAFDSRERTETLISKSA